MVGDISNYPKNYDNRSFWHSHPSSLDLTSASWSRIMLSSIGKNPFGNVFTENGSINVRKTIIAFFIGSANDAIAMSEKARVG